MFITYDNYHHLSFSISVTYIGKDGERREVKGKIGDNLLHLAHRHGIDMEGEG